MSSLPVPDRVAVPADPRDLPGPFRFRRPVEIRFGDTDAMGHVNNAVYLTYCELARASYYEAVTGRMMLAGDGHAAAVPAASAPPTEDSQFILAEARLTFRAPAYFGETLMVEVRAVSVGRTSFRLEYRLTAPDSPFGQARLIAVADSVLVAYDYRAGRPLALPAGLVADLERFEGRPLRG
ncbi:MAG TPA: thioesterase family protein [Candidatus Limnocylindrales bacterium]